MQKETAGRAAEGLWKKLINAMRANRKLELAIYGAIVSIIVAVYLVGLFGPEKNESAGENVHVRSNAASALETEDRLRNVLSCIRGAGRVEVMITYETSGEIVTALSTSSNSNASESTDGERGSVETQQTLTEQPATFNDGSGDSPIILMEREPVVRGVIVVSEGAADLTVKMDLERAVRAVLDVPLTAIEVFELGA